MICCTLTDDPEVNGVTRPQEKCRKANILFAFSFVTVSLASGLVYGWPSLRRNLVNNNGSLNENDLGLAFTMGAWSTQGGRFFFGIARDRFLGTRGTACLSLLLAAAGCLGIAFFDVNSSGKRTTATVWGLCATMFLVGLGSGSQLCVQPVAGMFRKDRQGLILNSLSGAFQIAGLVFPILTGISNDLRKSFGGFAFILLVLTVLAATILPRYQFINIGDDDDGDDDDGDDDGDVDDIFDDDNNAVNGKDDNYQEAENRREIIQVYDDGSGIDVKLYQSDRSLPFKSDDSKERCEHNQNTTVQNCVNGSPGEVTARSLLLSFEYILLVIWSSFIIMPLQYYVATIGFQLERKGDDNGKYTRLFSIIYASCAVLSPILGKITDILGLGFSQGFATTLCAACMFCLGSDDIDLNGQVVGFVLYGIGRMMILGSMFTNIGKRFGYTYYGTLVGVVLIIHAIVSLLQYPLIAFANQEGNEKIANDGCGVLILFMLPYCFWLALREKRENNCSGHSTI